MADRQDDEARKSQPAQESSQKTPALIAPKDEASNRVQTPSLVGTPAVPGAPSPPAVAPLAPLKSKSSTAPSVDPRVLQAITEIEAIARKTRQEVSWFSLSSWKDGLDDLEKVADDCVNRLLTATLTSDQTKKDLLEVVKDRRSKIPLSTGITTQIIGICQSLLAFGAGGLGLSVAFIDKATALSVPVQKYLAIVGIFYIELVIVSVFSLMLYMIQARFRYPSIYFKKIGNAWPWFYYSSISRDVPRWPIQPSPMRVDASALYAKDFVNFTMQVLKEDCTERLRNEIQQYFLLMSYQGYVNQFSLRLANFFMYGFTGAFISMLIMIVLVRFFGLSEATG